jgi:hypothetical protein
LCCKKREKCDKLVLIPMIARNSWDACCNSVQMASF